MSTYIMMTQLDAAAAQSPQGILDLEKRTMASIRASCPEVEWRASFALLGEHDYCDVFDAPSLEAAFQVAAIVRSVAQAKTAIWSATPWRRFEAYMRLLVQDRRDDTPMIMQETKMTLVTAAEVERVLGEENAGAVAAVLALEPSFTDFEMALTWIAERDSTPPAAISDKAKLIADIIASAEIVAEEDEMPLSHPAAAPLV